MVAHQPVLLTETTELLALNSGAVAVDATCGAGGHTEALARAVGPPGRVIAIDQDDSALAAARERLAAYNNIIFIQDNFRNLSMVLRSLAIQGVAGILADLGLSSMQLADPLRGFSFTSEHELDMRQDTRQGRTAADLLRTRSEAELGRIFREYGEERNWRAVARAVIRQREEHRPFTGVELRRLVHRAAGAAKSGNIDAATRVFQALRIAVNDELKALPDFLEAAVEELAPGGRIAVIAYHSLEDRLVKTVFRREEQGCRCPKEIPQCVCGFKPRLKVITRKPVMPDEKEVSGNSRARSAKLRVAEKVTETDPSMKEERAWRKR